MSNANLRKVNADLQREILELIATGLDELATFFEAIKALPDAPQSNVGVEWVKDSAETLRTIAKQLAA